ncbi:MAG: hypothetical protein IKT79_03740, partial [Akkermansia sp.]|nr:hypothetical protein [Akkermansia sp.]
MNNETGYVITGNNSTLRLTDLNGSLTNSLSEGVTVNVGSGNSATVEISGSGATMSASDITRTSGNLNITVGDGATLQLTRGGASADINGDLFIKAGGTVNSTVEDTCGWDSSSTKNVILVGEEGKLATLNLAARVTQTANVILGGNAQILSISSANAYDPAALDSFGGKIIATGTNNTIDVPVFERMALTIEVTGVDDTLDISGRISHASRPNNAGSITKTGLGTLTLSYSSDDNTNEIYGLLSVEAGTLKFTGDTMLTTGIKVASGASLVNEGVISISSVQSLNKFGNSTTYQDVYGRVSENGYLTENYAVVESQAGASITGVDSVRLGGDTLETLVDSATGSIYICYVDKSAYLVNTEETYDANTMGAVRQFSLAQGGTLTFDDNGTGDECRITSAVSGRGKLVLTSERETAQNYIFSGDIFGWNGTLENTPSTAVTTNVTFCGSAEINASVVNSGAGSLNVTIDNSAIGSTSAVTVNGAITATTLSITEGTTVNIRNSVVADTITLHEGAVTRLNGGAVVSGNIDGSGTLQIKGNNHVSVNSFADSFAGSIDLRGGVLAVGNSLVINQGRELTLHSSSGAVLDADLSLGDGTLYLDNEGYGSGTDLNNNTLNLLGGTQLKVNGGYGNRVFNLFSNVGNLLSVDGSVLQLTAENNSITNYFDTSLLGSGDWSDSILQLTEDGTLQLVFHKDLLMLWFNERQTGGDISYHHYEKISFEDCSYTSSPAYGGAIFGSSYSNITLSDNVSVTFSGNTAG